MTKMIQSIFSFFDKSESVTNLERIFDILISIIAFLTIGKIFGFIQVSWYIIFIPLFVIVIILVIFVIGILYISNYIYNEKYESVEW